MQRFVAALLVVAMLAVGCASQTTRPTAPGERTDQVGQDEGDDFPWFWALGGVVLVAGGLAVGIYLLAEESAESAGRAASDAPCCSFGLGGDE